MNADLDHTTIQDEYNLVHRFISNFFVRYFTERNCDGIIDCFDDDVVFVGLTTGEVTQTPERCRPLIQRQIEEVSSPIPYSVSDYKQNRTKSGSWNCYAILDLHVESPEWGSTQYKICVTIAAGMVDHQLKISMLHVSESRLGHRTQYVLKDTGPAHRELGRIMSQVVPGGIASRYTSEGAPILMVNEACLTMLQYATYEELRQDCGGLYENVVHPDDLEKFRYMMKFLLSTNKQCESDYRLRCRDGQYIWVHDTSRAAVTTDGKDLVVSSLTDMSTQLEKQRRLERESETDHLTSLYNRRGAARRFRQWESPYRTFALLLIDVDNFKQINDLYGHQQGDKVLKYLAGLVDVQFGTKGIVCRMGGDEFLVFIPDYSSLEELTNVTHTIIDIFKNRMDLVCPEAHASISVGGVYGQAPFDFSAVYGAADNNMYTVKGARKNGLNITEFHPE